MNSNTVDEENKIFEHNIKKEPEVEFLCVLPNFDSSNSQNTRDEYLVRAKQENEIQSKKIPKYQCKLCQKVVKSMNNLRIHEKTHQNQQCKVCNRKVRPQSLDKHMKSHQNEKSERKFKCKICSHKFMTNSQLKHHILNHSRRFQCDLCRNFSDSSKNHLLRHLNLHLVEGRFKCLLCRKLFDDKESLRFHSRQVNGDPKNCIGLTKADSACGACGKEFHDDRNEHEKMHGGIVQCPNCGTKCQPRSLTKHELKKKVKKFMCDICDYENTRKFYMRDHLDVHLNPQKGKCNICSKIFSTAYSLNAHSRTIHHINVEPSKLCCKTCHVKLPNLLALRNHNFTHKNLKTCPHCSKLVKPRAFNKHMKFHELKKKKKDVECKICQLKFHTITHLYRHMKSHIKSLECDLCEYRAGRKDTLQNHMVKHMKALKFCPFCFKFTKDQTFTVHMKMHELTRKKINFECKMCQKLFNTKYSMNLHFESHLKRLECDLCEYRTGRKSSMTYHMVNHMKLESLKCENCLKTFQTAYRLKAHTSRAHKSN